MASEEDRPLDPLDEEMDKYVAALGALMLAWADVEGELYLVLRHYTRLSDAHALAIFSGTRASGICGYLNAILHNDINIEQTRRDDLEFVLPQIAAINKIRDKIVHFSFGGYIEWDPLDPTTRFITNKTRVSRYGNHFVEKVGSDLLSKIIDDLYAIQNHLNQHWHQKDSFSPWQENPGEPTTWLYKPAQPDRT